MITTVVYNLLTTCATCLVIESRRLYRGNTVMSLFSERFSKTSNQDVTGWTAQSEQMDPPNHVPWGKKDRICSDNLAACLIACLKFWLETHRNKHSFSIFGYSSYGQRFPDILVLKNVQLFCFLSEFPASNMASSHLSRINNDSLLWKVCLV